MVERDSDSNHSWDRLKEIIEEGTGIRINGLSSEDKTVLLRIFEIRSAHGSDRKALNALIVEIDQFHPSFSWGDHERIIQEIARFTEDPVAKKIPPKKRI